MRMTRLFLRTLRDAPADAEVASHQLLVRAGYVQGVASGIFEFLPLGQRVKRKVEAIIRQEMDAVGGQEVALPVVQPAELWQRTGRWWAIGDDMARLRDRNGRDLCLGMTHEEVVTDLAGRVIESYRQLPCVLYQIQTKFRDEPRPRAGLIRVREFTMKDAYSFHASEADLDAYYPRMVEAYERVFRRCSLDFLTVQSDTGMMGGTVAHEFMALSPIGEDVILTCDACGYRANRQVARFRKPEPPPEPPEPLERVHTPGTTTIAAVAEYLGVGTDRTAKAVFLMAELADAGGRPESAGSTDLEGTVAAPEKAVFVVLRGDTSLCETKLANLVRARALRPATEEEIRRIGAEPGFGSPVGIDRSAALVVADDLVAISPNLVGGANEPDHHLRNVNYGRDFEADLVADVAAAEDGAACPSCGQAMRAVRGIEVGNTFKLGTRYSAAMGALFTDAAGEAKPMVMGCYGIGSGRLIASVVEQHRDDQGIVWPAALAPYDVMLVALSPSAGSDVEARAEELYVALGRVGVDVLYDDRAERAGVKFNDADLIGLPLRLTVGDRGLARGVVECRRRRDGQVVELPVAAAAERVKALVDAEPEAAPSL